MGLNNPKTCNAWAMYDWANSAYSLTIVSAVFPAYLEAVTEPVIDIWGFKMENSSIFSYTLSIAFLIISIMSPILSGIADSKGNKKSFMKFFVYLGSIACAGLFFFNESNLFFGLGTSIVACVGFAGSIVFYNAFLPEIATPDRFDKLSAKGFSLGYIGSVLLLILNLALIMNHEAFGITEGLASRISFLSVAIWWAGFAQITFKHLPNTTNTVKSEEGIFSKGFKELSNAWNKAKKDKSLFRYLVAFFFYNMAVQTVMYLASFFGVMELKLETSELILTILIIQLVAIAGAHLFSFISKKLGNILSLILNILSWIGICFYTYFFVYDAQSFFIDAFFVGLVMGGIQSISRSTYSKLIPDGGQKDSASYFSLYEVCEKVGIAIGTFSFGFINQLTGSMRNSVLALSIYFIIGMIILFTIKDKRLFSSSN